MSANSLKTIRENLINVLIINYLNIYLQRERPSDVIDSLHRILKLKKEVIDNLATFAHKQINEKNRNPSEVYDTLAFYSMIFHDYIHKNNGQPIKPYE
jgi:hypothetical protein